MDFNFTPEDEKFRAQFRAWLDQNRPEREDDDLDFFAEDEGEWNRRVKWFKKLASGGWTCVDWPKEYGGRGFGILQTIVYHQELGRVHAPLPFIGSGVSLIGPTLMHWGTEEQKKRFIPKVLTGAEIWCQGYSEPGSGSDLASLQTRAVEDGDHFVVNGQKVWTSWAQHADWIFLLVRTDPSAPKHQGISYLLVDMHSPGVIIRPLKQITGESEFNEVFFENVRVPRDNLVGELNHGWMVGIGLLMHERATTSILGQANVQVLIQELVDLARQRGRHQEPVIRQRLAQLYTESEAVKYYGYRCLTKRLRGLPPGPEGSAHRLVLTRIVQRAQELAMELEGPYAQLMHGSPWAVQDGAWQFSFLRSRSATIAGGTAEIQLNIIGERVLGLPKG